MTVFSKRALEITAAAIREHALTLHHTGGKRCDTCKTTYGSGDLHVANMIDKALFAAHLEDLYPARAVTEDDLGPSRYWTIGQAEAFTEHNAKYGESA